MARLAQEWKVELLVHLAASGTVLTARSALPRMLDVSVDALITAIDLFQPQRVLYASSCAVYGNAPATGGKPCWADVKPVGVYGLSKAMAELMLTDWARETGSQAILLRLGNVVGANCRGLISYLVRHALTHPDGDVPARMRGGGRVLRDYVPVNYVARVMEAASQGAFEPGAATTWNVGSGRTMSNGEVASLVREVLSSEGYKLEVVFDDDVAPGEAWAAALRTEATERDLGLSPPSKDDVRAAIVDGVRTSLLAAGGLLAGSRKASA
jgi:UDP-glucose 4-epimerase